MDFRTFGIAADIISAPPLFSEISFPITVAELRRYLSKTYPPLNEISHYMVAVNQAYASDEDIINLQDEIAIIPPVSGG